MKLMIVGYAEHGKDTVCQILRDEYNMKFRPTSVLAAEKIIYPKLKHRHGYQSALDCFIDRKNHRQEWFELISDYNSEDKSRFIGEVLAEQDIYCGVRCVNEYTVAMKKGLFDVSIWVDRSRHKPVESGLSCTMRPEYADTILDNNGSLEDLRYSIRELMKVIALFGLRKVQK